MNVHSYGQEVVWSVAFFLSVGQSLGHALAFFFSVGWRSTAFAAVIWPGSPGADLVQRYSWLVHALSSHVLAACSLLC